MEQARDLLTAFYKAEVIHRRRTFIDDQYTAETIRKLAECLTSDTHKIGFLLCGTCGNGKTTLLYALRSAINYLNDNDIFEDGKTGVVIYLAREIAHYARNEYPKFKAVCTTPIIGIDDMGEEPNEVIDYGNIQNPIAELMEYRYIEQLPTFITTNLAPGDIKSKYKTRISDRFREMLEIIVFDNKKSYR